jgi:integrase
VPLARQSVDVLRCLQELRRLSPYVFPGERDHARPMSNNTILKALERMGYKGRMTGHGFRGVASTALHEHGFEHALIELHSHTRSATGSVRHTTGPHRCPRARCGHLQQANVVTRLI